MSDVFHLFKNRIGGKKPPDIQPVLSKENRNGKEEHILDSSPAIFIDLPQITKPDLDEDRKPQEYWKIYNKGLSFYKRKWYEKAKDEFLKLLDYKNPHRTFYTYLLKTYRKIIGKQMESRKFQYAYKVYEEFFDTCEGHITDTDRRKFNRLIEKLLRDAPGSDYEKVELVENGRKPDFEITELNQRALTLLGETKMQKRSRPQNRKWKFISDMRSGTLYVDSVYDREHSKYVKSLLMLRDSTGNIEKEFAVNHGIYRFKATEDSDRFVASSDDMILYLYSIQDGCLGTYDLRRHTDNKYHVRCVDISPEGKFLLFTHVDRAFLMNSSLQAIGDWRTPPKEGREKRTPGEAVARFQEYQRSLAVLGLSGQPTYEEIKKAFRAMVLRYHPDRNPNDPRATERTREIINAYEKSTGEEAKLAFRGVENAEYYYKMMDKVKVEIPGTPMSFTIEFGMLGPGEDWIYATCLGPSADTIYLGCYSGKVYCMSKDGRVTKLYNCRDVIRSIREKGK
ncbi:MAG: DnaJ domain-containing protein [Anaerolineae bacterium]|nr:DnaJ domain-containing protein [Anaerolineae bacterium]